MLSEPVLLNLAVPGVLPTGPVAGAVGRPASGRLRSYRSGSGWPLAPGRPRHGPGLGLRPDCPPGRDLGGLGRRADRLVHPALAARPAVGSRGFPPNWRAGGFALLASTALITPAVLRWSFHDELLHGPHRDRGADPARGLPAPAPYVPGIRAALPLRLQRPGRRGDRPLGAAGRHGHRRDEPSSAGATPGASSGRSASGCWVRGGGR